MISSDISLTEGKLNSPLGKEKLTLFQLWCTMLVYPVGACSFNPKYICANGGGRLNNGCETNKVHCGHGKAGCQ